MVEHAHHGARTEVDDVRLKARDACVTTACMQAFFGEFRPFGFVRAMHALVVGKRRRFTLLRLEYEPTRHALEILRLFCHATRAWTRPKRKVRWSPIVVVAQGHLVGPNMSAHANRGDVFFIGKAGFDSERNGFGAFFFAMRG